MTAENASLSGGRISVETDREKNSESNGLVARICVALGIRAAIAAEESRAGSPGGRSRNFTFPRSLSLFCFHFLFVRPPRFQPPLCDSPLFQRRSGPSAPTHGRFGGNEFGTHALANRTDHASSVGCVPCRSSKMTSSKSSVPRRSTRAAYGTISITFGGKPNSAASTHGSLSITQSCRAFASPRCRAACIKPKRRSCTLFCAALLLPMPLASLRSPLVSHFIRPPPPSPSSQFKLCSHLRRN